MSAFQKVGHLLREKILVGERKLEAAVTGFFGKKLQQKQVTGSFGSGVCVLKIISHYICLASNDFPEYYK